MKDLFRLFKADDAEVQQPVPDNDNNDQLNLDDIEAVAGGGGQRPPVRR